MLLFIWPMVNSKAEALLGRSAASLRGGGCWTPYPVTVSSAASTPISRLLAEYPARIHDAERPLVEQALTTIRGGAHVVSSSITARSV